MLTASALFAQPDDDAWFYGFQAGATQHRIQGVESTIIPMGFAEDTYTTTIQPRLGFTGGLFVYHRFYKSRFAIQPEISFSSRGGDFLYTDIRDLEYAINFKYQFVSLGTLVKLYPAGGLHFGVGLQASFNVAPDRLTYASNRPDLGPDLQIQQSLREVLSGRNDIQFLGAIGYDFPFGLMVSGRYVLGLSDVIETGANGFNFSETVNNASGFQVTIGWAIEFPN